MKRVLRGVLGAVLLAATATTAAAQTKLTIATVNNGDMIRMQGLTDDFTAKNPDITLEWVTLEENVLAQKVTTDIATKGGQFDVLTIGTYEVPIWAQEGLAGAARQPGRRLRRGRSPAGDPRRPRPSTASSMPRRSTAKARW